MINEQKIFNSFKTKGNLISYKTFGSGHINNTYVSKRDDNGNIIKYTHQRINKNVFIHPDEVMENINNATQHIEAELKKANATDIDRRRLEVIKTLDDKLYYIDEEGNYWRTYGFIDDVCTYEVLESKELALQVGDAIGKFQKQLSTYTGDKFHETIKDFHNMNFRYEQFDTAVKNNVKDRLKAVEKEVNFFFNCF